MNKNNIKILGAFGGKTNKNNNTCIQVSKSIVVDAGNILAGLQNDAKYIDHIFLTHSHLDHLNDIAFFIDQFFEYRKKPLYIYGIKHTLDALEKHILNWEIWPDFTKIELENKKKSIIFKEIKFNEAVLINDISLCPIKTNHTVPSCGYIITKKNNSILFTSDTYSCKNIWDIVNKQTNIKSVIIDVSFPSKFKQLAKDSKHLTPLELKKDLKHLKRDDVKIFVNHLKPSYINEITKELKKLNIFNGGDILKDFDEINLKNSKLIRLKKEPQNHLEQLIEIGYSLTSEKRIDFLLEKILLAAKSLSNADGGTLYLRKDSKLEFKVVKTDSLNITMGGSSEQISWPALELFKENGEKNNKMVAALCALENKLINIKDVYIDKDFDFSGTKEFDKNTGYRSKSMLVIPMTNYEGEVIGVIQLINKKNDSKKTIKFNKKDEKLIKSMASQAAVSIDNNRLIKNMEELFDSFIKTIGQAVGIKSVYTGGHINRVAKLAKLMALEIHNDNDKYKEKTYSKDELREITIASWLHDIGKMTTPEYILDKATKLETIFDRINFIEAKFEIVKKDLLLDLYKKHNFENKDDFIKEKNQLEIYIKELENDFLFLKKINYGIPLKDEDIQRIKKISKHKLIINGEKVNLLNEDEVYNLSILRGTLTNEERDIINNHVIVTYDMLKTLPFPKKLKRVPTIAGSHHKKVNGGGYCADEIKDMQMSIEDKILAIADIFEALTANDRPYKKANSLNKSLKILEFMVKDGEIDKELMQFFIEKELHLKYAKEYLNEEQIDEITVDFKNI